MNRNFKKYVAIVFAILIYSAVHANTKDVLKGVLLNTSNKPVKQASVRIHGGDGPVYSDSTGRSGLGNE